MRYRQSKKAAVLIEQLCREEEGIMRAEQAVEKVDRNYLKYAQKMEVIKWRMEQAWRMEELKKEYYPIFREEGRQESAIEIARKMKNANRPLTEIAEFTELSMEVIEKL
jgi:pyruvate-formate lyase